MNTLLKTYWRVRIFLLFLKWIRGIKIGTKVKYKGEVWTAVNGTYASPSWDIMRDGSRVACVPESELSKVKTIGNYLHGFKSGYRFYMTSWFRIWVDQGVKPWMRRCNIWG
jgi:hypothetical protein